MSRPYCSDCGAVNNPHGLGIHHYPECRKGDLAVVIPRTPSPPAPRAEPTDETSVICRQCGTLVGGVEAGARVRWVVCFDCQKTSPELVGDIPRAEPSAGIAEEFEELLTAFEESVEAEVTHESPFQAYEAARAALLDHERRLREENDRLREFAEYALGEWSWGWNIPDGGSMQDKAKKLGLIVKVPADEAFRAEYDADTMFAVAWSDAARAARRTGEGNG